MRISDWSSDVCSSDLKGADVRRDEEGDRPQQGLADAALRLWRFQHLDDSRLFADQARLGRQGRGAGDREPARRRRIWQGVARRRADRTSAVEGKGVSVRVGPGGRRDIKKKKKNS